MVVVLVSLVLFLVSCTNTSSVPAEQQCSSANDCVPDACCHATGAVAKEQAPDCSTIYCTMECAPGTLDCGQGKIECQDGTCVAVISEQSQQEGVQ